MEKIFKVMHNTDSEGVDFTAYQLKDVAYQWYEKWEQLRDNDAKPTLWDEFLGTFLDCFFSQELREAKVKKFINLKQGKMSMK